MQVLAHVATAEDDMRQLALVQASNNRDIQVLAGAVSSLMTVAKTTQSTVETMAVGIARLEAAVAQSSAALEEQAVLDAASRLGLSASALRAALPQLRLQPQQLPPQQQPPLLPTPPLQPLHAPDAAAAGAPLGLAPFVKLEALASAARVWEEWHTGLGGAPSLASYGEATAEQRRVVARAAGMKPAVRCVHALPLERAVKR